MHDASGVPVKTQVSEEEVRKYRLDLLRKKEKGKEPAQNPPEEEEQPAGISVASTRPVAGRLLKSRLFVLSNLLTVTQPPASRDFD